MIVEICASNFQSAVAAEQGGADRIELCSNLEVGGLTPSHELLRKLTHQLAIPIHVLVRPRAGDFVYSEVEMSEMLGTIAFCKSVGCAGIVSGALTSEGNIDIPKTHLLKEASEGMHFTFHRAFDLCIDPYEALEQLIQIGANTILTSGQKSAAIKGIQALKNLKTLSEGKITIMPGAGINDLNAAEFIDAGFEAIHLSAIRKNDFKFTRLLEGVSGISDINMIRKVVAMAR